MPCIASEIFESFFCYMKMYFCSIAFLCLVNQVLRWWRTKMDETLMICFDVKYFSEQHLAEISSVPTDKDIANGLYQCWVNLRRHERSIIVNNLICYGDMMTSSNGNILLAICAGNSPVPGEFPAQRPVTRSFDVFFDLHPNKRLSKQWWGWC